MKVIFAGINTDFLNINNKIKKEYSEINYTVVNKNNKFAEIFKNSANFLQFYSRIEDLNNKIVEYNKIIKNNKILNFFDVFINFITNKKLTLIYKEYSVNIEIPHLNQTISSIKNQFQKIEQKEREEKKNQAACKIQYFYRNQQIKKVKKAGHILGKAIQWDQAARKIQQFFRSQKLPLAQRISFKGQQPVSVMNNRELKENFVKGKCLGGGGEGFVLEIKDKKQKLMALKIATSNLFDYNKQVAAVISTILRRGHSPHLTQIHQMIGVKGILTWKFSEYVFGHVSKDDPNYLKDIDPIQHQVYIRRAYLMEIMEGDLEELYHALSLTERDAIQIQVSHIHCVLRKYGVIVSDDKLRNILYKKLTPDDLFQGKRLIDYDYWKYRIVDNDFYLPRPSYLIKLADYDPWQFLGLPTERELKEIKQEELMRLNNRFKIDINTLAKLFPQPTNPNQKILDMNIT